MSSAASKAPFIDAIAQDVLPMFGLAFLVDDRQTTWVVTRSTSGPGLEALQIGQRVHLTIEHHAGFSVVAAYRPCG